MNGRASDDAMESARTTSDVEADVSGADAEQELSAWLSGPEFLRHLSHELRTPLVTVRGYIEMMARGRLGPINDTQRHGLQVALRNTIALTDKLDTLLEYSRLERGTAELAVDAVSIADLLHRIGTFMAPAAEQKGLVVTTELPPDRSVFVRGDADKLTSLLRLLVGAAIRYTDDGAIALVVEHAGDESSVSIRVCTPGPVSDERMASLRDHVRGRKPQRVSRGGALGLTVAAALIRHHGSCLEVDPDGEDGLVFSFELPTASSSPPVS